MTETIMRLQVENTADTTLAVIFGDGSAVARLASFLGNYPLTVRTLDPKSAALPVFWRPRYFFYFLSGRQWDQLTIGFLKEALTHLPAGAPGVIFVLDASPLQISQLDRYLSSLGRVYLRVQVVRQSPQSWDQIFLPVASWVFSSPTAGQTMTLALPDEGGGAALEEITPAGNSWVEIKPPTLHRRKRAVFRIMLLLFLAPALLFQLFVGLPLLLAALELKSFGASLGDRPRLAAARTKLELAKNNLGYFAPLFLLMKQEGRLAEVTLLLDTAGVAVSLADSLAEVTATGRVLGKELLTLPEPNFSWEKLDQLRPVLTRAYHEAGFLESRLSALSPALVARLANFAGVKTTKNEALAMVREGRAFLENAGDLITYLPNAIGRFGPKKYLVVLQNSAELRPTGGFIGSFALVGFDQGRMVDLVFNDVYTADGQLQGRVNPPDEILHFLGQPGWYLRDANWAADFPLTAKRLEWFLDKEMGKSVDGVIALDLYAVEKLLAATGPVFLPDYQEEVTAETLFAKAEFQSEINFFPGSTQKRDYLSAVARAILHRLTESSVSPEKLLRAVYAAGRAKNVLLYFKDSPGQELVRRLGFSGSLTTGDCPAVKAKVSDCLAVVEANFGANKANYYLERKWRWETQISKGGDLWHRLSLDYKNNSPSRTWPGGDYKNYLRFLVPPGSRFRGLDQGDDRRAKLSPLLTADVLSRLGKDEFLVYESSESGYLSWGTLVVVPVGKEKTVRLEFISPQKLDFRQKQVVWSLHWFKQPGTGADPAEVTVEFPTFWQLDRKLAADPPVGLVVFPAKVTYNRRLTGDWHFALPLVSQ